MNDTLVCGIKGESEKIVTEDITAGALCSGSLPVFATPAMIAMMEETCFKSIHPMLEEGYGTVGTRLEVDHLSPTPVGMKVRCESMLIQIDGRKLTFDVKVYDEKGLVGTCVHERFIINNEKFMAKASQKSEG
jgi:predicted thioesterase